MYVCMYVCMYVNCLSSIRYLFQTYPSVRGHTLFRSKDRLLLTKVSKLYLMYYVMHCMISNCFSFSICVCVGKAIIDNVFDIDKLVADQVV